MKRNKEFLLLLSIFFIAFSTNAIYAGEIEMPKFHVEVAVQSLIFSGDDIVDDSTGMSIYTVPSNRFEIRHAGFEIDGEISDYAEYCMEISVSTCGASSGAVSVSEASLFYKPLKFLKAGIMKGHSMRGFELYKECTDVLTAEKPRFATIFSQCHPTGAVIEADYDIDERMGIHAQAGYFNGLSNSIDDEHDINMGLQFRTPVEGLAIGGFYTDWQWKVFDYAEMKNIPYDGSRMAFGALYENYNAHISGEYYLGTGFNDPNPIRAAYMISGDTLQSEDLEMNAFYVEGGYTLNTGQVMMPFMQPYLRYQSWNKAANADGDNTLSYLTAGITLGLGSSETTLRIDYEMPLADTGILGYDEANKLIVRMQGGLF
ncbi:MAG: hypothetical protein J7K40_10175 [candidate division Zixibacteria bacterium]|nr:hypothetical protein [candidate division Zixibacteria bacterium]